MPIKAWAEPKSIAQWILAEGDAIFTARGGVIPPYQYIVEEVRRDIQKITGISDLDEQRFRLHYHADDQTAGR